MHVFPQHGCLLNMGFCVNPISSSVWFLPVIHHHAGPGGQNDVNLELSRKHKEHWHKALIKFHLLPNSFIPLQKPQHKLCILSTGRVACWPLTTAKIAIAASANSPFEGISGLWGNNQTEMLILFIKPGRSRAKPSPLNPNNPKL